MFYVVICFAHEYEPEHRFVDATSTWKIFRTQLSEMIVWILYTGHPTFTPVIFFICETYYHFSPSGLWGLVVLFGSL